MSLYIIDNLEIQPELNFTYRAKIRSLLESGFDYYNGQSILKGDSLLVGIFGCPYLREQTKKYRDYAINVINNFANVTFLLEDLHPYTYNWDLLYKNYSNYKFITCYFNVEEKPKFENLFWVPHHVDTDVFKPLSINKKYDILVYGSLDNNTYPERCEFINIHKNQCFIINHPGYNNLKHQVHTHELNRYINESRYVFVSPSKYNYLVAKYFEAAASCSYLVGSNCMDGLAVGFDLNNSIFNYDIAIEHNIDRYNYKIRSIVKL